MLSEDRIQRVGAATSSSGYDYFEIANADRCDYTLIVEDALRTVLGLNPLISFASR